MIPAAAEAADAAARGHDPTPLWCRWRGGFSTRFAQSKVETACLLARCFGTAFAAWDGTHASERASERAVAASRCGFWVLFARYVRPAAPRSGVFFILSGFFFSLFL